MDAVQTALHEYFRSTYGVCVHSPRGYVQCADEGESVSIAGVRSIVEALTSENFDDADSFNAMPVVQA